MRRSTLRAFGLAALLVALSGLALAQGRPPGGGGPAKVGVMTLKTEDVPYVRTLPGRAVAFERTEIRPRVSGSIVEILYAAGAALNPGDPMFRIEDATYRAALASAKAAVSGAEAELFTARATADRYRALQGSAATAVTLQTAEAAVAKAESALAAAQANLESAQIDLDHTIITSPIAGVAGKPEVSVGALVTANQTVALATVTRLDPIFVDVADSSSGMLRVRDRVASGQLQPGDRIGLQLLLETGLPYNREGELVVLGTEVSSSTGTVDMRIRFDNPDRLILPGQFLRVAATLGTVRALLVPQRAAARSADGTLSAWVARDGKVHRVVLETSGSHNNAWVVTAGVQAGEQLVVDGLTNLREGAAVATVPVTIDLLGVVRDLAPAATGAGN
ncbi:efflux RND transporter periplasmic adaptor subunit [Gemmobacter sp.]|uniref:efflux RND transporter periplasmic adaptor subunit n=1 Tax=Gemmobacter sp. TaxID=1898957 RepID=UPI002AFE7B56|nr:efflux RND transporter periplasmic adaptor subunit [Gemmobacter sp.]